MCKSERQTRTETSALTGIPYLLAGLLLFSLAGTILAVTRQIVAVAEDVLLLSGLALAVLAVSVLVTVIVYRKRSRSRPALALPGPRWLQRLCVVSWPGLRGSESDPHALPAPRVSVLQPGGSPRSLQAPRVLDGRLLPPGPAEIRERHSGT